MYRQTFFKPNKYGAVRQTYDGISYDSKFEATVAADLDYRLRHGEIKAWERQFKVEIYAYTKDGTPVHICNHRVDFRVYHLDNGYELLEAKGMETLDYKMRRRFLETIWLPEHPDHFYTVVKQRNFRSPKSK